MIVTDYILNGQAHGDVADRLLAVGGNTDFLRPILGRDGKSYFLTNVRNEKTGKMERRKLITNAPATLRREDWLLIDQAILKIAKERLQLIADLRGAGLTFTVPQGLGKTVLETHNQSDITPATIGMDPVRASESDRPIFDIENLPLPVIYKDFDYTMRELMVSRNGGSPLDTTTAELASRRVIEGAEQLALGLLDPFAYGGGTVYGLLNYPGAVTFEISDPSAGGWTPAVFITEILTGINTLRDQHHYGPYKMYVGTGWDVYLDGDYSAAKGDNTLRDRVLKIKQIQSVDSLDYMSSEANKFKVVLVEQMSDVIRLVIALELTTLQWESTGGLRKHFKVMTSMTPQLRADQNGQTGIGIGSIAESS